MNAKAGLIATGLLFAAVTGVQQSSAASASHIDVRGGWQADLYTLKDGTQYPVRGQILFTEKDWSVLFFVMKDGAAQRGSGEGGSYKLKGDQIVLRHRYHVVVAAPELPSLKAQPEQVRIVPEDDAKRDEPAIITIADDKLTINFGPSGNHMSFIRSSAP